jgi:hypothetical protein
MPAESHLEHQIRHPQSMPYPSCPMRYLEWDVDERPALRYILDTADRELNKPGMKEILMNWEGFRLKWSKDVPDFGIGNLVPDDYLSTDDPDDA